MTLRQREVLLDLHFRYKRQIGFVLIKWTDFVSAS